MTYHIHNIHTLITSTSDYSLHVIVGDRLRYITQIAIYLVHANVFGLYKIFDLIFEKISFPNENKFKFSPLHEIFFKILSFIINTHVQKIKFLRLFLRYRDCNLFSNNLIL